MPSQPVQFHQGNDAQNKQSTGAVPLMDHVVVCAIPQLLLYLLSGQSEEAASVSEARAGANGLYDDVCCSSVSFCWWGWLSW